MRICTRCGNCRWVCEAHPYRPWGDVQGACCCGAPGKPLSYLQSSGGR
jgi:hypothetical protein